MQPARRQKGFTLIELLVVIGIVGILIAIAIPQFAAYRGRAFDTRAKSDLRNMAVGEEAYFIDNGAYIDCDQDSCDDLLPGIIVPSEGVSLQMNAGDDSFTGSSSHPRGTGVTCFWDSASGGFTGCS